MKIGCIVDSIAAQLVDDFLTQVVVDICAVERYHEPWLGINLLDEVDILAKIDRLLEHNEIVSSHDKTIVIGGVDHTHAHHRTASQLRMVAHGCRMSKIFAMHNNKVGLTIEGIELSVYAWHRIVEIFAQGSSLKWTQIALAHGEFVARGIAKHLLNLVFEHCLLNSIAFYLIQDENTFLSFELTIMCVA